MLNNYLKRINIICGHYGCGKTNFALNLAMDLSNSGTKVTLVDLDVVNPYFRSGDYKKELNLKNIKVIAPTYVKTNVDLPSIPAEVFSIFAEKESTVIIDLGGDDAGAYVLARFLEEIKSEDYALFYLTNFYRYTTTQPKEAEEIFKEIQSVIPIAATGIINNSHLQEKTTETEIKNGYKKAKELSKILKLPLVTTTYPDFFLEETVNNLHKSGVENMYSVKILVKAF